MNKQDTEAHAWSRVSYYAQRADQLCRISVTRLGGSGSIQVNDGPITRWETPYDTLVLSIDGKEMDRAQIGPGETYSVHMQGGRAWIEVEAREGKEESV